MESTINNGMCRCCASEGTFKDVKSSYHWMGEEEIYSDMLRECFDVSLLLSEDGNDGGICEVCITQLRNAANFKKQVQHTEEQFKLRLDGKLYKSDSIVKIEPSRGEDDDNDSDNMSGDDFSGAEYEVPIKTEKLEETKPKKRPATSKPSTSRAKKTKNAEPETSTKRTRRQVIIINSELEVSEENVTRIVNSVKAHIEGVKSKLELKTEEPAIGELEKHHSNIIMIMECSNATPIRRHTDAGYACCFCTDQYKKTCELKRHTIDNHSHELNKGYYMSKPFTLYNLALKLDITGLRCKICDEEIDTVEQLIDHLISVHTKKMYTDIKNQIIPLKFDHYAFKCFICMYIFGNFKQLLEHMMGHYRYYVCDDCGAGFINKFKLRCHSAIHRTGTYKCDYCPKVFRTAHRKKVHEKCVHVASYKKRCGICHETFDNNEMKEKHLNNVHGIPCSKPVCHSCDKVFANAYHLRIHTQNVHLM